MFCLKVFSLTHAHTHTKVQSKLVWNSEEHILLSQFVVLSQLQNEEQNKVSCFIFHFISVALKKKPLRASSPYVLYICLIPPCLYVCSDFQDKQFWTKPCFLDEILRGMADILHVLGNTVLFVLLSASFISYLFIFYIHLCMRAMHKFRYRSIKEAHM